MNCYLNSFTNNTLCSIFFIYIYNIYILFVCLEGRELYFKYHLKMIFEHESSMCTLWADVL